MARLCLVLTVLVGVLAPPAGAEPGTLPAGSAVAAASGASAPADIPAKAAVAPRPWKGPKSALGRTLYGGAITLLMVAGALALVIPIGIVLGALAGGGSLMADALLARLGELSSALPPLLVVGLVHAADLMPAAAAIALVLGVARGIELARVVRGEMLRVTAEDFVMAARALGLANRRLVVRHILPHALAPMLVSGALTAAAAITLDAALGLFGLGSSSTWGGQIAFGLVRGDHAHVFWPALAAIATTAALYVLAEALSEGAWARGRSGAMIAPARPGA